MAPLIIMGAIKMNLCSFEDRTYVRGAWRSSLIIVTIPSWCVTLKIL